MQSLSYVLYFQDITQRGNIMETFFGLVLLWAAANNSADSLDAVKRSYQAPGVHQTGEPIPQRHTAIDREIHGKLKLAER
jgi:hypothetical protein